jgi:hypothetical protein
LQAIKLILEVFYVSSFYILQAQEGDSIADKLNEYLIAANKVARFNGNVLIAEKGEIILQKSKIAILRRT